MGILDTGQNWERDDGRSNIGELLVGDLSGFNFGAFDYEYYTRKVARMDWSFGECRVSQLSPLFAIASKPYLSLVHISFIAAFSSISHGLPPNLRRTHPIHNHTFSDTNF